MLSWANVSLIEDGRSQSDIRQGVTLEVMGEGWSMGPYNDKMKEEELEQEGDIKYDINWTTLDEYLSYLEDKGISCNVASFVGAGTVRIYVLGYEDRAPNNEELSKMKELVKEAMEDGALGVGSALIYAPNFYAKTDELIIVLEDTEMPNKVNKIGEIASNLEPMLKANNGLNTKVYKTN